MSIPVGVWMSRSLRIRQLITPVLDLMQTLPSFVYLIPTVMIFGPGKIPALIATIVYAAPPLVRLTDLGLRSVDPAVMEASRAFGTNPRQRLFGVQIPLALPTILAGINQTTMMALSMVVIASMIGAGGLGYQVLQGIGRLEVSRGLFAGLGIVALAIIFDRITQSFGKQLQGRIGLAEVTLMNAHDTTETGTSPSPCAASPRSSARTRKRRWRCCDAGKSKAEVQAETDHVVGLDNVSLDIAAGPDLRGHGPVRLRQVDADPPRQPADRADGGRDHGQRHRRVEDEPATSCGAIGAPRWRWCSRSSACCRIAP